MGKTRYKAIIEMINKIPEEIVHLEALKIYIKRFIATREKTALEVFHSMREMGLIEEIEPYKFKLNKNR